MSRGRLEDVVAEVVADPESKRQFESFVLWVGRLVERRGGQKMPETTKMLLGALLWDEFRRGGSFASVVEALKSEVGQGKAGAANGHAR